MACHFERSDRYGMMADLLFYKPDRFLLHDQLVQTNGYVHYQVLCNVVQHLIDYVFNIHQPCNMAGLLPHQTGSGLCFHCRPPGPYIAAACPDPLILYSYIVSPSSPTGPRAWILLVLMPLSLIHISEPTRPY